MEKDTKIVLIIVAIVAIILAVIFIIINLNIFPSTAVSLSPVTVYDDINYGGSSQAYDVGAYTLPQMQERGTKNDFISSVEVSPGYTVTFYQDNNFKGASIVKSESDTTLVDDNWNDKVSSMLITKNP